MPVGDFFTAQINGLVRLLFHAPARRSAPDDTLIVHHTFDGAALVSGTNRIVLQFESGAFFLRPSKGKLGFIDLKTE